MSRLPKVGWRLIQPARTAVSGVIGSTPSNSGSDIIATVKSQVINSCSLWSLVESPNTGSQCIILRPNPLFSTSSNMNVVLGYNITGSSAYRTPDTNIGAQYNLQVGMTPDVTGFTGSLGSGSFKGFNADRPFQSATGNPRWSGYWHAIGTGSISASFIVECEDSIFFGFKTLTSGTQSIWAGALFEVPDSGSGEADGRLYGIASTGPNDWGNFWSGDYTNAGWLSHGSANGNPHMGVFTVSGGVTQSDTQFQNCGHITKFGDVSMYDWAVISGSSATRVVFGSPVFFVGCVAQGSTPLRMLGIGRGILLGSTDYGVQAYRTSLNGTDLFYRINAGHNSGAPGTGMLFYPASGSGL